MVGTLPPSSLSSGPLDACQLPTAWSKQNAWTILDSTWNASSVGGAFFEAWQAWRSDPLRPRMLHYVAVVPSLAELQESLLTNFGGGESFPQTLLDTLRQACEDVSPGFNRLLFEQGQVSLTVCIGPLKDMLTEQAFAADAVVLGAQQWDVWQLKQLAKCCRRGTRFQAPALAPEAATLFLDTGFQFDASPSLATTVQGISGRFDPTWHIATSRQCRPTQPAPVARCAIVGAGLSGATVAHALALRGWQVSVFDQHAAPAGGASGLPAGLVVPYLSADNSPRSRISRSGVRLMLYWAQQLLAQGQDWEPSGVQERKRASANSANSSKANIHWHPQAGWIKPAALVRALLAHPGIAFCGQAEVCVVRRLDDVWVLLDTSGNELGRAEQVVFANALACAPLLGTLPDPSLLHGNVWAHLDDLHGMRGTVSRGSYGPHTSEQVVGSFPRFPVNGQGSFLPRIPTAQGFEWLLGATYESSESCADPSQATKQAGGYQTGGAATAHAANLAKLQQLLPATGAALTGAFEAGAVSAWSGTRCVSHDRMPLVGPLMEGAAPSLWINAAMGSRGLSFSAVCAQLLVAQLCAEPLPVERSLARGLNAQRVRRPGRGGKPATAVAPTPS